MTTVRDGASIGVSYSYFESEFSIFVDDFGYSMGELKFIFELLSMEDLPDKTLIGEKG